VLLRIVLAVVSNDLPTIKSKNSGVLTLLPFIALKSFFNCSIAACKEVAFRTGFTVQEVIILLKVPPVFLII
jgi:hypothetical protein